MSMVAAIRRALKRMFYSLSGLSVVPLRFGRGRR
jgi:hypothetical protein